VREDNYQKFLSLLRTLIQGRSWGLRCMSDINTRQK